MTSLDSAIGGMDPDETVAFSDSETAQPAGNETASQTQNTMGKAQLDRVFQFAVEGCEKSYSRAGHLYRHQLNRNRPASRAVASCESGHGDELQSSMPEAIQVFASQSQDLRAVFPIPTELRGSPTAHQGFPISVNGYSDIPRARNLVRIGINSSRHGTQSVNPGFDSLPSSSYPTFGGETYSKPPFAMEDEFTAWLFNESSVPSSSVAYPSWRGVVPSYLDAAQLQTRTHELSLGGGISHRSMSVARTSDPGSPRTVMSDDKLQELLHLMATRFNKAACSTETTRKESFLEGDVNNDNHILSLRMTRTYIESYWYHFHPQLPILHRSAFVADHAPNLLLAITAIGVSTLDRIHGPEVIETVLRVGQFHRLASPMGGLLLIEVHEKMYSTRFFHERAHIHHGTTLALMRRGGLFIGRSADCSADDRLGSNTTPDSVLGESWTHWIRAEATRRAVFVALVLDSTHAAMFGQPVKMTAHGKFARE
ncbi:Transcription factor, fungi, partial [Metarhizium hybridum]